MLFSCVNVLLCSIVHFLIILTSSDSIARPVDLPLADPVNISPASCSLFCGKDTTTDDEDGIEVPTRPMAANLSDAGVHS